MSTEENKAVVRRGIEEVWNQKNVAIVDEIAAPDYVSHNRAMTTHGLEQYKQLVMMYFAAFPDLHLTIEDEIAEAVKTGFHEIVKHINHLDERVEALEKQAGIPHPHKH